MNKTLEALIDELEKLAQQLDAGIPNDQAFNVANSNWSFPGLSKSDLIAWIEDLVQEMKDKGPDNLGEQAEALADYVRRLATIRSTNTVGNLPGNPVLGVAAIHQTLEGLRIRFRRIVPGQPPDDAAKTIKRLTGRLAAMEARLKALEPRADSLDDMLARIEAASSAADALPEDLESLAGARKKVATALEQANTDARLAGKAREAAAETVEALAKHAIDAQQVLEKCDAAYSAATSQGLARAFSERSSALSNSMWFWTFALAMALGAGVKFGGEQLTVLAEAIKGGATGFTLGAALILAVLKLGGPVWFAWLATKQVGQRFRLSEDYAYKASISSAYEGYRKEAARIEPEMEQRLLASALDRLDEQPLRLVEQQAHGSPWQEAINSDQVRRAIAKGPEFAKMVKDVAASFLRGSEQPPGQRAAAGTSSKASDE